MIREEAPPCPQTYSDPALQRSFERYWRETYRPLSTAERAGWRRFWDGWCICPVCMPDHGKGYTPETWRVPANYSRPIAPTETCIHCHRTPRQVPIMTFIIAAIMEIYSHD